MKKKKKRKYLIGILAATAIWVISMCWVTGTDHDLKYIETLEPIGDRGASYRIDPETGYYCFTRQDGEEFRVLRLSDIHIGGGLQAEKLDEKTLSEAYQVIEETRPDLIVLTGDLIFSLAPFSGCLNNVRQMGIITAFMERMQIPWTVTLGNHDADFAIYDRKEIDEYFNNCGAKYLIYQSGPEDITGYGNTCIQVENPDGTVNMVYVLIDSNAYLGFTGVMSGYDYIHEDQTAWYAGQIGLLADKYTGGVTEDLPSIALWHIPCTEYKTAYHLYKEGSSEVSWIDIGGDSENNEEVCPTGAPEKETIFDQICALGSTKMIVCGHDHYNSFGIEYRGVRLCYGLALDHLAYLPTHWDLNSKNFFRGGSLISTAADGTVTLFQDRLYEEDTSMSYNAAE